MKSLFLFLSSFIILEQTRASTYVFNFAAGPVSYWNTASNWQGGTVPVTADSVILKAPAEGGNYTCLYNAAEVTILHYFLVGKGVKLIVLKENNINFSGKFIIDTSAVLEVFGTIAKSCPTQIINSGKIFIEPQGAIMDIFYCDLPSTFKNEGGVYNYSNLSLTSTTFNNNGVLLNQGSIDLALVTKLYSSAVFINNGSIYGNGFLEVTNLQNNGTITLIPSFPYPFTSFFSKGNLNNNGTISNAGEFRFRGSVNNKGTIISSAAPGFDFNGEIDFDSASIINDGLIQFSGTNPLRMSGSLINNNSFFYYFEGAIEYLLHIVNNGNFVTSAPVFKSSVINNKDMNFDALYDTSRIITSFINKGKLTTTGPIVVNQAFINSGELITQ